MNPLPWIDSLIFWPLQLVSHCRMIIFKSPLGISNLRGRARIELKKGCLPLRIWKSQQEGSHRHFVYKWNQSTKSDHRLSWSDVLGPGHVNGFGSRRYATRLARPFHISVHRWVGHSQVLPQPPVVIKTAWDLEMIYVHGEEHGLLTLTWWAG